MWGALEGWVWHETFLGHCGSKSWPLMKAPSWRSVLAPGGGRRGCRLPGNNELGLLSPAVLCPDSCRDEQGVSWAQAEGRLAAAPCGLCTHRGSHGLWNVAETQADSQPDSKPRR